MTPKIGNLSTPHAPTRTADPKQVACHGGKSLNPLGNAINGAQGVKKSDSEWRQH
jgi:hypothetical protein